MRPSLSLSLAALVAATIVAPASAQMYTELIREGDPLPGGSGELVTRIDNVDINANGDWLIELDTDAASNDAVVLSNGTILWQEGTSLGFTAPAGKEASSFIDVLDINDNGDIMFVTPLRDVGTTSTNSYLLVWNGITIIEDEVTPCNAPSLPAGSFYDHVSEVWQNNNGQLLVGATVNVSGQVNQIMLRVDLDPMGNIISERKLAMQGETLPGPNHVTPIQGFSFSKGRQAINDAGECMWYVDDDHTVAPGDTMSDSNMYMTDAMGVNTLVYNEGNPFPTAPGETFDHFSTAEIDLNNSGDFVFSGFDRGPSTGDSWIFKNLGGTLEVIAHEGDPAPASVPGSWMVAGFGFGGVVPMSDGGDVLWFLDWDDPDTDIDTGLMFNDDLLLQEGISTLGGLVIDDIPNSDTEIAMSDNGKFAILEVVLVGAAADLDAVFIMEIEPSVGTEYCMANANSTGSIGTMSATGSSAVALGDLTLMASNLPASSFSFFITSMTQGFVPNPNGSAGNLCLDGAIGRYVGAGQIQQADANGNISLAIDLTMMPQPTGFVPAQAGQTWFFQTWHRDLGMSGPTSNFTNGLEVLFN